MEILRIDMPDETIAIESSRPPEKMSHDDFMWCFAAVFSFTSESFVIEASLFGFLKKLLDTLKRGDQVALLNDENGAYQLTLTLIGDNISLEDSFGGGAALFPLRRFLNEINIEFLRVTEELEDKLNQLSKNREYIQIRNEIERGIMELNT